MRLNTLEVIVCDSIEQFKSRYKKINTKCEVLCLTKNMELLLTCSQLYTDVKVRVLESEKSYMSYAESAWNILDEINTYISRIVSERTYIYHMNYDLEGNAEAMQVVEMLMFNDMFDEFFSNYKRVKIVCFYNEIYAKDIEKLYFWCRINRQKFFLNFGKCKWDSAKLRLFALCIIIGGGGGRLLEEMTEVNSFARWVVKLSKLKRKMDNRKNTEKIEQCVEIGIIKETGREKDYNWTKDYLNILDNANIGFRFICMNEKVKKQWEEYGYKADNIEESLEIDALNKRLKEYRLVKKQIWGSLKKFLENKKNEYDIRQMRVIIKSFLCYTVVNSIVSDTAANVFFKTHYYKIIDLHTNTNSISSRVCCFNAKRYSDTVKIRNCTGGLQIQRQMHYEPYGYLSDFGFVTADAENNYSKVKKHQVESVGRKYILKDTLYTNDFYTNSFRMDLLSKDLRVAWAPSGPCTGLISYVYFLKTGLSLIQFFSQNNGKLIIKFHPHQREEETNIFKLKGQKNNNIIFQSSEANIRNVLKKVDILITNCSLSALDAVIKKKAVICVVCKYEYEAIKQHEEGLYIVRDYEVLNRLLQQLSENVEYRKNWIADRINKQDIYFSKLIDNGEGIKKMVWAIKKELS